MMTLNDIYHVFTEGLKHDTLFKSESDYIYAMNRLGLCSLRHNVSIIAFCLMDNHIHILLRGGYEQGRKLISSYVKLCAMRVPRCGVENVRPGVKRVADAEYMRKLITYIHRNPLMAGHNYIPSDYPWSSARLYFRNEKDLPGHSGSAGNGWTKVESLPTRKVRNILSTRYDIPKYWWIDGDKGLLWPGSYTDFRFGESFFTSSRRYLLYLNQRNEMQIESENDMHDIPNLSDKELRHRIIEVSKLQYGEEDFQVLGYKEKTYLAKEMRRSLGVSFKQLARIIGIPAETLKRYC